MYRCTEMVKWENDSLPNVRWQHTTTTKKKKSATQAHTWCHDADWWLWLSLGFSSNKNKCNIEMKRKSSKLLVVQSLVWQNNHLTAALAHTSVNKLFNRNPMWSCSVQCGLKTKTSATANSVVQSCIIWFIIIWLEWERFKKSSSTLQRIRWENQHQSHVCSLDMKL